MVFKTCAKFSCMDDSVSLAAVLIHLAFILKLGVADGFVRMTIRERHTLVVDDYPDALDIQALYLRALGYRVSTTADGAMALRKAERLIPATHDIPLIAAVRLRASRFGGATALSVTSSVRQPSHIAGQSAQENG
jgi:hypothetical protein